MSLTLSIGVYFVVWWTTLFLVLPFGVRTQAEDNNVVPGTSESAPTKFRLGRTILMTTLIASLLFAIIFVGFSGYLFKLDDIPFLPKYQ